MKKVRISAILVEAAAGGKDGQFISF